jgi:hypothetical protein
LCNPLNAEDFEQETDGDTSNIINKLVERAKRVPWNIFVLAIDKPEDFMKKKREKFKIFMRLMNSILQFTNGIRYVPNLIVFFSTDHIGIVDHPYFNRERTKIFLGNPSYRGRKEWIQRNKSKGIEFLNEETENTVAKMTINFSHNAMNQLFKNLENNLICEGKINFKIDLEYAKKFILEICSTEKISFGKYSSQT